MNLLDVRTVIISHAITDVVCTVVLASLWARNRKRFAGTLYWLIDFAFQATASLLIVLRGSIPDWISIGFSNTLVLTGAFLGYWGFLRFIEKKGTQIHNYILLVAFVAVHFYFIYLKPDLSARNFNLSLGLMIVCIQCAWLLLSRNKHGLHRMTRPVGLIFGVFGLVSIVRMIVILASPHPSNDFFKSGTYDTLLLMSYQILLICLTFGLVLMVNRRLYRDLQTQEEKFTKTFRSSPYAITLTRPSDGKMIDVNDGFIAITGYSYTEALGKTTVDLRLWAGEPDRAAVVDELSKGNRVVGREYQFTKKSGELMTGLFSAEIIMINEEALIMSSISDITDRKRAEEAVKEYSEHLEVIVERRTHELNAVQAQLVHQGKLAVLGQLAGSVGHELRNPLGIISNAVYFLAMAQPDADEKVKEYLRIIENEICVSEKIISDLLDFAGPGSGERQVIAVSELVQRTIKRFPPPPLVDIAIDLPVDLPAVYADAHQIIQVLGNLVINACQAMTQESSAGTADNGKLTISAAADLDTVGIRVRDTGIGISSENMKNIFEPLFTTKAKGIGLGLVISKKLAEANGGRIEVMSEPGEGSTFTVYLPIDRSYLEAILNAGVLKCIRN
jgi:PAS domain S-box-containing protein